MSLTLYHTPGTPSFRILWLLEELHAQYELIQVGDAYSGDKPDRSNPHPHGFTPTLVHGNQVIFESGAIVLYLNDLCAQSPVSVPVTDSRRGTFLSWLFYQVGVSEPLLYMKSKKMLEHDPQMSKLYSAMTPHIEQAMAKGPYLLGESFSAVDVLFMGLFEAVRPMLGDNLLLDTYLSRSDRSARHRAMLRESMG